MNVKEFIKTYGDLPTTDSPFIYVDEEGKKYSSVEEAYRAGKQVTIKNTKDAALQELAELGIEKKGDANKFVELVEFLYGKSPLKKTSKRGRKTYTEKDKEVILKEWEEADNQSVSKSEFCRDKGLVYQTFIKWLKDAESNK
ncbi:hypothetical protein QWY93_17855 [Echinicola jeungdonensis]|uniref:Uncharacterized protein n=1 Tax=Echinicola jeungdonensis TaxID=709343 RepID=A0ABV5J052_9BACT|nr:hypothetical protein [Echinicola jeungdonensis]MDN3671182.1 hypothetical protein [Echinicola jeungdonensis]